MRKRNTVAGLVAGVVLALAAGAGAKEWPGFTVGMGMGGWLTNYKRFNVLPMDKRLAITKGDLAHFDTYITEGDVARIKMWGFDHIRLGFDQIVMEEAPGKYRERTFKRLEAFVGWCRKHKINAVLNLHKAIGNYCDIPEKRQLLDTPELQDRFVALWLEVERRFHDAPEVAFELLNEVRDVDPEKWNSLADRTLKAIRELNHDRWVVIGSTCWNSPGKLKDLRVWDDPRVVYTFHMYSPHHFTHQRGVLQAGPLYQNDEVPYPGTDYVRKALKPAVDWAAAHPDKILWNGEFGTIRHMNPLARADYMRDVVAVCKEAGIPWSVWNYLSTPNDGNRFSLVDDVTRDFLSDDLQLACLGKGDAAARGELKYMAFNIWGNYFGNPVFERDLKQAGYVLRNAPDLVGMQEAMPEFWSSRLFEKLGTDYGIVRNEGNPKMEYNPLLWRKSRLELIEGGTHVYADNPEKSKGFGWGVFRDKATGQKLISYSTHLWWKWKKPEDQEMRVRNARELLAKMSELQKKYNCPVVGGGDLNCTRAHMEKGLVTPLPDWEKAGYADAQYTVRGASPYSSNHGDPRRDALGNYRGWIRPDAGDPKNSLDHVHYTTNGVEPIALVVDRAQDALEVSDHSPVIFTFRLSQTGDATASGARPEWGIVLEQEGSPHPVRLNGARMPCDVDEPTPGVRRFRYGALTDGKQSWNVQVELEERATPGGKTYTGRIANNDNGIRVTAFEGPYYDRVRVDPQDAALYVPCGLGQRERSFPRANDKDVKPLPSPDFVPTMWRPTTWYALKDGRYTYDTSFHPGVGSTMPWLALTSEGRTLYAGAHDAQARPKRMRVRWNPEENRADVAFDHRLFLPAGETCVLPETVFETLDGDWHAAAKRYRRWYDATWKVRAAAPDWTKDVTGWLLVILKQQNEELMWPYTDIPKLCDVAERNGLNCIGLFGWTVGGHDHLYPDYDPDPKMGGVHALKAGIAEAHRRGIRVCVYANGQLQQVGATRFWDEHGKDLALVMKDGKPVIQTYHKYRDIPEYQFALGCLYGKPWFDRMYSLAEQAESFGADAILYDQLGVFAPFACYGKGHGHPTPHYSYSEERPAFIRRLADGIQKRNPNFAVLTEGLHDTVLDSIGMFHGCEFGAFAFDAGKQIPARAKGSRSGAFPELWAYTFPELVTTMRFMQPMLSRTMANIAVTFGFRHDIEVRYMPDRAYVLDGKMPTKKDYGTVVNVPDIGEMTKVSPAEASAYLKSVCDFQRAHAKYLMRGRFVDDEGFTCADPALTAKRFVAADGTSAVCVWNMSDKPVDVKLSGLGDAVSVHAPAGTSAQGPLAANSLRLYLFGK